MERIDLLAAVLVIVGGLNWGLVAVAEFDLVAWVFGLDFGETNAATRVVYGLVGLCGGLRRRAAAGAEAEAEPSQLRGRRAAELTTRGGTR